LFLLSGEIVPGEEMIFIKEQPELKFDEASHTYTCQGQNLTSVSSLISNYSNKFDPDGSITARKAKENNLTVEQQLSAWKIIGDESRTKGTAFHADIESYIKTKKIPETPNKELIQQFANLRLDGAMFSEVRLCHVGYGIAGTTDLIQLYPDNSLSLGDYKTNKAKKMTRFSFGRKMLSPLTHIFDSTIDKYEIQLSAYAFMLEEAGWWVRDLTIYHIDYDKTLIKEIPLKYRRNDVIRMLEHYKSEKTHN
jgi:hypothetical protein